MCVYIHNYIRLYVRTYIYPCVYIYIGMLLLSISIDAIAIHNQQHGLSEVPQFLHWLIISYSYQKCHSFRLYR